jgi:serine/threonine-protein kinase
MSPFGDSAATLGRSDDAPCRQQLLKLCLGFSGYNRGWKFRPQGWLSTVSFGGGRAKMPEQVSSYRLEGEMARGGMGIVYRGMHTVFEEIVAIKAIYPELTLNPELRERFLNEAKIQRRLQHPNIVQIREFLIEQGKFYIVMEFIEGETLTQYLRQLGRPMLASEVIPIFRQALEGLGFAHSQGVIHRDIKPSNIMLTRQGVVKLTDFGIARALGSAKLTRTGTALGTAAYMSPEQIQGTKLDHRADIYSLGITLYEMLTGSVPFEHPKGSDSDYPVLEAHMHQAPTPPSQLVPEIPPFLEAAILKALEKRPENRFESSQKFQAALVPPPLPATRVAIAPLLEPKEPVKPAPELSERKAEAERAEAALLAREKEERERAEQERLARERAQKHRKERTRRAGVVSLLTFVIVALAALAWVYWPSPRVPPPTASNPQTNENPPVAQAPKWHRGSATGQVQENPKHGLKYVWIPPGSFMMGCSPGDSSCDGDEKPSHRVTISKGFWIGQTEVTVRAYKRFAAATGRQMPQAPSFNSAWANDNMPIVSVSWDDARDYCTWAGGRLLTEAEWEYAARGGSTAARYANIDEIAWYQKNSGDRPHDVARKRANGFGLFDMLGNVFQWVNDWCDGNYYQSSPSQDPPGPTSGEYRVVRGASWGNTPKLVRASSRLRGNPDGRHDFCGLRCGREAE